MPINRDLSDLPRPARPSEEAWPPDKVSRFGAILVAAWAAAEAERPDTRLARFRHSDAGACARAIAYAALGATETNPITPAGAFIATQGTMIHEAWQDALQAMYPQAEVEVEVIAGDLGGHVDAVIRLLDKVIAIEIKTTGGYGYKDALGLYPAHYAHGPKLAHILQASLNGLAVNADEVVVVYLAREGISHEAARKAGLDDMGRVTAEWTLPRERYETYARGEMGRVEGILDLVDRGYLPKRKACPGEPGVPDRHLIVEPEKGTFVVLDDDGFPTKGGTYWACNYCRFQDLCVTHHADRTPIEDVALWA